MSNNKTDIIRKSVSFTTGTKPMWQISLLLITLSLLCLPLLEFNFATTSPLNEISKLLLALLQPDFLIEGLIEAILQTISFAVQALSLSALLGFFLSLIFHLPGIRQMMSILRSVHELFWALLLIQLFGLSTLTGLLALAIPYAATFARVFSEIQQETTKVSFRQLKGDLFSRYIYSTFILVLPRLISFSRYRLECALRASVILGFVGLPTLGFQLDGYLKTGQYEQVAAIIYIIIALVLSMKIWTHRYVFFALLLACTLYSPPKQADWLKVKTNRIDQFVIDLTPTPFKTEEVRSIGESITIYFSWLTPLWTQQIMPGIAYTLLLGQFAFALSAFLALLWFPLISKYNIISKIGRHSGHLFLVSLRSLPELLLAFLGLIILGPSLIPGILALGIHNGAIIAHLTGEYSNELKVRIDVQSHSVSRSNRYFYEVLPRVYNQFLVFSLYRGEIILRETAVLGILGIPTLGFYIDSAFEEFRLDRAVILIAFTACLNIFAEYVATVCRRRMHTTLDGQHSFRITNA